MGHLVAWRDCPPLISQVFKWNQGTSPPSQHWGGFWAVYNRNLTSAMHVQNLTKCVTPSAHRCSLGWALEVPQPTTECPLRALNGHHFASLSLSALAVRLMYGLKNSVEETLCHVTNSIRNRGVCSVWVTVSSWCPRHAIILNPNGLLI